MMSILPLCLGACLQTPVAPPPSSAPAPTRAAFELSTEKPSVPAKGVVARVLNRVDGGDFHGFGNADGSSRKHDHEDVLHTMTIRLKFHF